MAIKAIQDIGFNAYLNYYCKIHFDKNCYFTGDSVGKINYFVAIVMIVMVNFSSTMDFNSIVSMDLNINHYYYYHSYNFITY